ncbi:hypothetical protein SmJEL517_g04737 [Synchytrium microbalum]|uniref:STAS domain-containing protein n=1 Tax=Synchytrium microbalum TaxID=1806994 RepID=A0A507BXC7_9FUNG|nr:uncharacterized protein SmJEL517_g04737 [Synchytrium microbalum]TPX32082.1 hypothetical protein SmJEL517_g04737 [Synchytrium microbalum]
MKKIEIPTVHHTARLARGGAKLLLWLKYYVPVLGWFPNYDVKRNLLVDFMAGLTVAFLLIPGGLAYSALVQVPPVYGLLTGFVPLVVYSLLGNSRQLSLGPEALVSTLVGAAIAEYNAGVHGHHASLNPGSMASAENVATASLLCFMVGLWTFALGVFRLGFLDSVISRPLLRGFITAIAVVVGIEMLATLLGLPRHESATVGPPPSTMDKLWTVLTHLPSSHVPTIIISVSSIVFLLLLKVIKAWYAKTRRWLHLFPEILVLVAVSTILSAVFRWDLAGVVVLKDVQGGVVAPALPVISLTKIKSLLLPSILIAVIGFVESIVGAKSYAAKHHYPVSPNRELVALGMANLIGCSFGSWPCFGSLGRTVVNDAAGAKTQMSGLITGLFTFTTSIWLLPYFYFLPRAVCSAIIIVAVGRLVEWDDVRFILRLQAWSDLGLLLLTFATTVFVSIEAGTLISVGVSLLLVVKQSTKTRISILGMTHVVDPDTGIVKPKFRSIQEHHHAERIQGCLVIRVEEGLFFGNSGSLPQLLRRVEAHGELGVHPGEAPKPRIGKTAWSRSLRVQLDPQDGTFASPDSSPALPIRDEIVVPASGELAEVTSLVLDVESMTFIDASATQVLLELVHNYQQRDIVICFVKLRDACKSNFVRSGIYDLIGPSRFFVKTRDALVYLSDSQLIPSIPSLTTYVKTPTVTASSTNHYKPRMNHESRTDDSNSSTSYHSAPAPPHDPSSSSYYLAVPSSTAAAASTRRIPGPGPSSLSASRPESFAYSYASEIMSIHDDTDSDDDDVRGGDDGDGENEDDRRNGGRPFKGKRTYQQPSPSPW